MKIERLERTTYRVTDAEARAVATVRRERGVTGDGLALLLHRNRHTLEAALRGKRSAPPDLLERCAHVLGCRSWRHLEREARRLAHNALTPSRRVA
jgi:hypothetical protein